MGADMILYAVPKARLTPERRQALLAAFAGMDEEQWGDVLDRAPEYGGPEDDREGPFRVPEEAVRQLAIALDEYGGWWDSPPRDLTTLGGACRHLYLSGGPSWGDMPTESASTIDAMGLCQGVWALLDAWALGDYLDAEDVPPPEREAARERRLAEAEALQDELETALRARQ